jgi:hypothetical protein
VSSYQICIPIRAVRCFVAFGERATEDGEESTSNVHAVELKSVEKESKSEDKRETEWQEKVRKMGEVGRWSFPGWILCLISLPILILPFRPRARFW